MGEFPQTRMGTRLCGASPERDVRTGRDGCGPVTVIMAQGIWVYCAFGANNEIDLACLGVHFLVAEAYEGIDPEEVFSSGEENDTFPGQLGRPEQKIFALSLSVLLSECTWRKAEPGSSPD